MVSGAKQKLSVNTFEKAMNRKTCNEEMFFLLIAVSLAPLPPNLSIYAEKTLESNADEEKFSNLCDSIDRQLLRADLIIRVHCQEGEENKTR